MKINLNIAGLALAMVRSEGCEYRPCWKRFHEFLLVSRLSQRFHESLSYLVDAKSDLFIESFRKDNDLFVVYPPPSRKNHG
jgi:hypothetical protein